MTRLTVTMNKSRGVITPLGPWWTRSKGRESESGKSLSCFMCFQLALLAVALQWQGLIISYRRNDWQFMILHLRSEIGAPWTARECSRGIVHILFIAEGSRRKKVHIFNAQLIREIWKTEWIMNFLLSDLHRANTLLTPKSIFRNCSRANPITELNYILTTHCKQHLIKTACGKRSGCLELYAVYYS